MRVVSENVTTHSKLWATGYWFLFSALVGAAVFGMGTSSSAQIEWDTIKTDSGMFMEGVPTVGECIGLVVSNHGEMGRSGLGRVNLDFVESGLECGTRPEDAIYLFSGSPFVILADDAAGTNARLACSYGDVDGSKVSSWIPTDIPGYINGTLVRCLRVNPYLTGRFVNADRSIAMERAYYAATDVFSYGSDFVVIETKLYPEDGRAHSHITVGSVIDWDVPSDLTNVNVSGLYSNILFMQGTDTSLSQGCQSHAGRYATEYFGGGWPQFWYDTYECSDSPDYWGYWVANQKNLRDTNLAADGVTVLDPPRPDAGNWWEQIGSHPGIQPETEAQNQAIWLTYLYDHYLGATDTIVFWTVLATVRDGSLDDLRAQVYAATEWYAMGVRVCYDACCRCQRGDATLDGNLSIGDVTLMIDAKFISGTCDGVLNCVADADANESGGISPTCDDITIGDITLVIDYLFITGPSLSLPFCKW